MSDMTERAKLTDTEWREFQQIPEQGYSHRAWIDHKIAAALSEADRELADAKAESLVIHDKGAAFHARAIVAEQNLAEQAAVIEAVKAWDDIHLLREGSLITLCCHRHALDKRVKLGTYEPEAATCTPTDPADYSPEPMSVGGTTIPEGLCGARDTAESGGCVRIQLHEGKHSWQQ